MDYFKITQQCNKCQRGAQTFQVHLSLYDANGLLINAAAVQRMDVFKFTCHFCWENTQLDFYRFSHPDVILLIKHLKNINDQYKIMKQALNQMYICLNNIN